jgi:hypothetical protein
MEYTPSRGLELVPVLVLHWAPEVGSLVRAALGEAGLAEGRRHAPFEALEPLRGW